MKLPHPRVLPLLAIVLAVAGFAACAGSGGLTFTRLSISPGEIRESSYETAHEVLSHHREIVLFVDRIAFRGGDDREGLGIDRQTYTRPLLVVNGERGLNDPITVLRLIPAEEIAFIELWRASMVPPAFRR
jgi:hypothetical protein